MFKILIFAFFQIFLFSNNFVNSQQQNHIDVNAGELGVIRGSAQWTIQNPTKFWAFNGIPYAEKASYTKENRFKPSVLQTSKLDSGAGPFRAGNAFVICPQVGILGIGVLNENRNLTSEDYIKILQQGILRQNRPPRTNTSDHGDHQDVNVMGQEDCLVLSVNTKNLPVKPGVKHPVIMFFHGGGSNSIWGGLWNGIRFLQHDVVLVSVTYRLGILGSLNLGIDNAPGNAALYDAYTSLLWVNKYIHYFGGDPDRVIVTGQSAGANMATQLLVSPLLKDKSLFHGVIGCSGSANSVWATARVKYQMLLHLNVAHYSGCYNGTLEEDMDFESINYEEIVVCMRNKPFKTLVNAALIQETDQRLTGTGLGYEANVASVQYSSKIVNTPKILPEAAIDIIKRGEQSKIPLILGATKHDGSFAIENLHYDFLVPNGLDKDPEFLKTKLLARMMELIGLEYDNSVVHALGHTYFREAKNTDDFESKIPGLIDLTTVFAFRGPEYEFLAHHSKLEPKSYFYTFDQDSIWTLYDIIVGHNPKAVPGGVAHTDDMLYLFQFLPLNGTDLATSQRFIQYFVNFAYYGNPNGNLEEPEEENEFWPRYEELHNPFLKIEGDEDQVLYDTRNYWFNQSFDLMDKEKMRQLSSLIL